ncbi:MAG TPA: methyl-accepting chemotaxis protein [Methylomirabilota bacterium]|nr:methyl-accepting chemotaxis protein [Methylomirabilota bacterium]HUI51497.1 methyl-accepting chemotaxis protein [Terriglobales bacterium]
MFKNLNLTQKVVLSISAVLVVTSLGGFWVTRQRVDRQAEQAFLDKVRQITGMASATRVWYSQNLDKFVPNHEFKHIEQVPVVVAWKVAQQYAEGAGMEFKTPSLHPRDLRNQPDEFERRALTRFERDPSLKEYYERSSEDGREWFRYAQPVRVTEDCLYCHGDPVGAKDPFGYAKEGMKVGELRAAFAVRAPADELVADASSNSRMLLFISLSTLIAACLAVAWVIRATVIQPIDKVKNVLQGLSDGDLTSQLQVDSTDEVGQMSEALNLTVRKLSTTLGSIKEESVNLASASEEFSSNSQQITANSEETSAQAKTVTLATEEVNRNLQTVATATEEMSASISEIAKNATEAARVAGSAMETASETNAIVSKLGESSAEIGQVIKTITSIAQKTDLLALNATVEAARAGEVGAGFAVVANEVKELAKQTASATEDISRKIEAIQTDAKAAVTAIGTISGIISQVNQISGTIAAAVEEQSATTREMSRNLTDAARGAGEVSQNIGGVAQAAHDTSQGASESFKASQELAQLSHKLRALVEQFKLDRGSSYARRPAAGSYAGPQRSGTNTLEEEGGEACA